jgi:hypothetical protein
LTIRSRRVCPRASRIALIVASVPELTIRTSSIDGTSSQIRRASRVSISVGAPNDSPAAARSCTARMTAEWAWPRIIGPHEPT